MNIERFVKAAAETLQLEFDAANIDAVFDLHVETIDQYGSPLHSTSTDAARAITDAQVIYEEEHRPVYLRVMTKVGVVLDQHVGLIGIDGMIKGEKMTMKEFLSHCVACGGNWTTMMASGVRALWPEEFAALPETFEFKQVMDVVRAHVDFDEETI